MPEVYKAWESIFFKIEKIVDNKEYIAETLKNIKEFTDLIEENQKYI